VSKRTIIDYLFLVCDVMNLANASNEEVGFFVSQEKTFDKVDHLYLFEILKAFGFGENCLGSNCYTLELLHS